MRVNDVWVDNQCVWDGEKIVKEKSIRLNIDEEGARELIIMLQHKADGYLASKRYEDAKMLIDGIIDIQKAIQEIYKSKQVADVIKRSRQEAQEQSDTAEELDRIENELFPPRKAPEA